MPKMEAGAIVRGLSGFTGTENYTRHSLARRMVMTDGVVWLREAADCFWLVDAIASHLMTNRRLQREDFQVWKFEKFGEGDMADANHPHMLTCTDGNKGTRPLASQEIEYSDFPLDEITLFCERGAVGDEAVMVLMLPGER